MAAEATVDEAAWPDDELRHAGPSRHGFLRQCRHVFPFVGRPRLAGRGGGRGTAESSPAKAPGGRAGSENVGCHQMQELRLRADFCARGFERGAVRAGRRSIDISSVRHGLLAAHGACAKIRGGRRELLLVAPEDVGSVRYSPRARHAHDRRRRAPHDGSDNRRPVGDACSQQKHAHR